MTAEEIISVISIFLSGGLVVCLLNWFISHRSEKKARRVSALLSQIQNLYGPLRFFSSQNESIFELYNKKICETHKSEHEGKQMLETLKIANVFITMVTKNNEGILDVLRNNYGYIDLDDIEIFRHLTVDYTRLKTERIESNGSKTPYEIYRHIGEISSMRPEFASRVKEKFDAKKKELDSLVS